RNPPRTVIKYSRVSKHYVVLRTISRISAAPSLHPYLSDLPIPLPAISPTTVHVPKRFLYKLFYHPPLQPTTSPHGRTHPKSPPPLPRTHRKGPARPGLDVQPVVPPR